MKLEELKKLVNNTGIHITAYGEGDWDRLSAKRIYVDGKLVSSSSGLDYSHNEKRYKNWRINEHYHKTVLNNPISRKLYKNRIKLELGPYLILEEE